MKFVAQRVSRARLAVGNEPVSEIGCGLVVYFGVKTGDGAAQAEKCAEKIAHLRVFEDEAGKMNPMRKRGTARRLRKRNAPKRRTRSTVLPPNALPPSA